MTRPDDAQFQNKAHVRGPGTSFQIAEVGGDASLSNTDNSRSTTISLGAFGVIAGAVMALLLGFAVWKFVVPEGSAGEPPVTAQSGSATTSTVANVPQSGTAKELRLPRGAGVDVDGDDPKAKPGDGANGALDLYLDPNQYVYANGNDFTDDQGSEQQAQQRCTEAATAQKKGRSGFLPVTVGEQHCFRTSDGQVGWLRVKSSTILSGDSDSSIVLAVRVWPKP